MSDLRPAAPGDVEAIAGIWEIGWRDGHLGNVPDELVAIRTAETFRTRASEQVGDTTVAAVGDEVAGFVVVHGDEVEQVYVATSHRGSGIAGVLLAEAERQVAAAGHVLAWLAVAPGNARARAFYARSGWSDDGAFDYAASTDEGTFAVPCRRYVKAV